MSWDLMRGEGVTHAWIEALCKGYWYGFDPTNNLLVNDDYIKFSHGRDYEDCLVNKGFFTGITTQQQENLRLLSRSNSPFRNTEGVLG